MRFIRRKKGLLALALLILSLVAFPTGAAAASSCVTGTVNKVTVKSGQTVCIAATAQVGAVAVQQGGSLDVEGATIGNLTSDGAASITICGATINDTNALIENSLGPVTIGGTGCAPTSFAGSINLTGNRVGVTLSGASVAGSAKVTNTLSPAVVTGNTVTGDLTVKLNTQDATVTGNTVGGTLTVQLNYGTVIDSPNTAGTLNVQ